MKIREYSERKNAKLAAKYKEENELKKNSLFTNHISL